MTNYFLAVDVNKSNIANSDVICIVLRCTCSTCLSSNSVTA